jgi:hypothetical protein
MSGASAPGGESISTTAAIFIYANLPSLLTDVSLSDASRQGMKAQADFGTYTCVQKPISRYTNVGYEGWLPLVVFTVQNTFRPSEK